MTTEPIKSAHSRRPGFATLRGGIITSFLLFFVVLFLCSVTTSSASWDKTIPPPFWKEIALLNAGPASLPTTVPETSAAKDDVLQPSQENIGSFGLVGANLNAAAEPLLLPQAGGKQVNINFDSLGSFVNVENVFSEIHFSSPGRAVWIWTNTRECKSTPNSITRGTTAFSNDHFADLFVDFPQPVNNVSFYIAGLDTFLGPIAKLDYYRNGTLAQSNLQINGNGSKAPMLIQLSVTGITRIRIHSIVDALGITFDDFSFTLPAATPTPTPTPTPVPTPPPPPGNLMAFADEEAIDLQWTASPGATGYFVQVLSAETDFSSLMSAAQFSVVDSPSANAFATIATIPAGTNTFHHANLPAETEFTYVVTAMGVGGTSNNSNQASARTLAKPGCNWEADKKKYTSKPPAINVPVKVPRHLGWDVTYTVSEDDGLVISEVYLNGRRMADNFSIPYYKITTNPILPGMPERGELRVNSSGRSDGKLFSRLLGVQVLQMGFELKIMAEYGIDNIPGAPKSCLKIAQIYEFFAMGFNMPDDAHQQGPCEPSGTISTCTKFRPSVTYEFHPGPGESLSSINIPQRLQFQVDENQPLDNTIVVSRDRDGFESFQQVPGDEADRKVFSQFRIPVLEEEFFPVVKPGIGNKDNGSMDNFHQTNYPFFKSPKIDPNSESRLDPDIIPGCPECVHMHWRWSLKVKGDVFKEPSGAGQPLVFPDSPQSLDVAIVRYNEGEIDPQDYGSLLNKERIARRFPNRERFPAVLWYSSHGFTNRDSFFWNPAWFNFVRTPPPVLEQLNAMTAAASNSADGPTSIQFVHIFKDGTNSFELMPAQELPALPAGYALIANTGFRVTTTTVGTGPFLIKFLANSVSDASTFANLHIFHLDIDPFDPDKRVWVDRTVLSPASPGPDFASRTLYARGEKLGVYAIGNLVQTIPPDTSVVDLSAECVDSTDPIVAENTLTYTATIRNNGPQTATEVVFQNELSSFVRTDSFTSSQGTTKFRDGTIYGSIGTLAPGASATFTVVVKPSEGYGGSFPAEGKDIFNWLAVRAKQTDSNLDNNSVTVSTRVMPSPNRAPTVTLTAPVPGNPIAGPTQITVTATATDPDGTISKVRFFDGSNLLAELNGTGSSQFTVTHNNVGPGTHEYVAVATDNLGRMSVSETVVVDVNGPATVSLTTPAADFYAAPGSNIQLAAQASHPSGTISEVEFVANGKHIGHGVAGFNGSYTFNWQSVSSNVYTVYAVATDNTGVQSRSTARTITVNFLPTVSIVTPLQGQAFNSNPNIGLTAVAEDFDGQIAKVDFYANNIQIGTATDIVTNRFNFNWRNVANGPYSLTAVATDNLGNTTTSSSVNIGVNAVPARPGISVWFDDNVPVGATTQTSGDGEANGAWHWVDSNPVSYSGTKSHQSRNFRGATGNMVHSHWFESATAKLHADINDLLFTWVFLDINNMPREIMLEFKDASGWEHRAYWGENLIQKGVDGTGSRKYMGPLPKPGQWARLEVKAGHINLNAVGGNDLDGMSFVLHGGRAAFDYAGKAPSIYNAPPPTPAGDTVWVDGNVPAGAVATTQDDSWNWISCTVATRCHQSEKPEAGEGKFRQHLYTGAAPRYINPGDILFTHVLLDQAYMPDQIVIQWHDGTSWHRAYWGGNYQVIGTEGTENWRYMGGLPKTLTWVRLEVPASYVGLENKFVSGMAFGFYKRTDNGQVTWGQSGQARSATTVAPVLTTMSAVSRFFHSKFGYYYATRNLVLNDADRPDGIKFFVHTNQAPGTGPMYRFVNTDISKREFFYSPCKNCADPNVWKFDGIAFYVYTDATTPGVVPLYLYHTQDTHYFLTTNQSEAQSLNMVLDGLWGYVHLTNPLVPTRPFFLTITNGGCRLEWLDSSSNETRFRIEKEISGVWTTIGFTDPNVTQFATCTSGGEEEAVEDARVDDETRSSASTATAGGPNAEDQDIVVTCCFYPNYRVIAESNVGDSEPSNQTRPTSTGGGKPCRCIRILSTSEEESTGPVPQSDTPTVDITTPLEGQVVGKDLTIIANSFDTDGLGTLAKMEFYDGAIKLGEIVGNAPYHYNWTNAPNGPHTLTVKATDAAGVSATSAPVHVNVTGAPSVTITSPSDGTVVIAPGSLTLQATASDPEGSVAKVEFFQGAAKLGEDTTAPYSFAWNSIQAGSYLVSARVIDSAGLTATSSAVSLTVNSPPTVELTSPQIGQVMAAPGAALLVANVADTDSAITKVDFYQGTTLIGTSTTFPYTFDWTNIPGGNYNVTAKVTDSHGAVTTSAAINIIVNSAPAVSITSPVHKAMLTPLSNVVVNASASDPDGTISKVDFYAGSTLLGTDTTSPFSINWNNVASGSYLLSAQATDNRGAVTTSSVIAVTTPTFFDDFNDNSLNTSKWTITTPSSPVVVTEQGQQLRLTLPANVTAYNSIASNSTFDIRNATVQVEQVQAVSQAGWVEDHLVIEKDANNYFMLHTGSGGVVFRSMVNGVNDQLVISYNAAAHHFWRLRHDLASNLAHFETSPDAITWTTHKSVTPGFALTAVKFNLIAGAWGTGNSAPGAAIYDNFQYIASPTTLPPTCIPPTGLIISEFRLRGPNGSHDEFIEFYNSTDGNINVCTADGSSGWALVTSDGTTRFVLASGTVIPARSHYLVAGPGYGLAGYAVSDLSYAAEIPENTGLALFNTALPPNFTTANRLDAVGFTSSNSLYREGSGLALLGANVGEYSFFRKLNTGVSLDSGDNVADFNFVATNGAVYGALTAILGAPGPENRFSPIERTATLPVTVIDPAVGPGVAPNRVRDTAAVGPNAAFGTLTVRRKITNNTGGNITKLRFRISDITTLNTPGYVPGGSQSDMRVLSSGDVTVTITGGQSVLVRGTTVEAPPNQPSGGGLNSSFNVGVISLTQPLAPGQSINVQFVLGVQQTGTFRFFFNVEALP